MSLLFLIIFVTNNQHQLFQNNNHCKEETFASSKCIIYMNKQNKKKATENVCHTASNLSIKDFLFFFHLSEARFGRELGSC